MERGGSLHQLQMHQFQRKMQASQQQQASHQDDPLNKASCEEDEEQRKSTLRVGLPKQRQANAPPASPILKYLRIRIRNLFHVPLSVLNKSACILPDQGFAEALPVAWELLR